MIQRAIRRIVSLFALAFILGMIAFAQSPTSPEAHAATTKNTWQGAQLVGSSKGKLLVVTRNQPQRWQTCRIQSFTPDTLVCSRILGRPRSYLPEQVLALIIPGDNSLKIRLLAGFNVGLASAIWGTVVLVATCPACAVATSVVALLLFCAAGAVLVGDDQPDQLLYLAPGERLSGKFRFVKP